MLKELRKIIDRNADNCNKELETIKRSQSKLDNTRDFPGGAVVKNPPANAGDTGLIPGLGRSHMPQSN